MDGVGLRSIIGNPTPGGTAATVLYLIGFLVCIRAMVIVRARMNYSSSSYEYPVFWLITAWCLLLLGFTRVMNLHPWLSVFVKILALEEGWYRERRVLQACILIAFCATGLGVLGVAGWFLRGARWPYLSAFGGMVFLIGYVVVRLVSFHYVDVLLARKLGGITLSRFVESGVTLFVILITWYGAPPPNTSPEKSEEGAGEKM